MPKTCFASAAKMPCRVRAQASVTALNLGMLLASVRSSNA